MATVSDPISIQTSLSDLTPDFPVREEMPIMHVRKRNGALEPVDVNKIVRAVQRSCYGLKSCRRDSCCFQDHRRPIRWRNDSGA